jgi:MoxR-like ATPase
VRQRIWKQELLRSKEWSDMNEGMNTKQFAAEFETAFGVATKLMTGLGKVIKGREDTVRLTITALFADGHLLLEDYPGSGKTTLTKTLGRLISRERNTPEQQHILNFRRVQFTPDMLPGDVLGVNIFEAKTGQFRFMHGPIFAHIVLADEINRAGPKVQAAFLECMAEKQVTIDNVTHALDELFFVVGTQNPLDIAGTYPLPIVQLDRFLFKVPMSYVDRANELDILANHTAIAEAVETIAPACSRDEIITARVAARNVFVAPALREAIVDICQATRGNPILQYGASTRAALMLQSATKAWAVVNRRDFAIEDDLKSVLPFVLLHRLKFHSGVGDPRAALSDLATPILERLIKAGA